MTESGSYHVRRVGSSVIHATMTRYESVPAELFGRAVRVLRASKVQCLCGVELESSDARPIVVMRAVSDVSCRACRHLGR